MVGNVIYIFGGTDGTNKYNSIYRFDTLTKEIIELETILPIGLYNFRAATVGGDIYLFGGINTDDVSTNSIYKFSPNANTIELTNNYLPNAGNGFGLANINNNIYILAGVFGSNSNVVFQLVFGTQIVYKTISTQ